MLYISELTKYVIRSLYFGGIMNKKIVVYIFIIVMFIFSVQSVSSANISVNPGDSIQSAVNGASNGDTVVVYGNNKTTYTYQESVNINKKINIKSGGKVVIEAKNTDSAVFTVNSGGSGSSIQNFDMTKSNYCIVINNAQNCLISGNNIIGASLVGIQFYGNISNSKLLYNQISGANPTVGNGISFEYGYCSHNNISGNNITNFLNGILFNDKSEYNSVERNTVTCTGLNGAGIYSTDDSCYMRIVGNTVTGAEDGIAVQQLGTDTATNYLIDGNNLKGNKNGMWICLDSSKLSNNLASSNIMSGIDITGRYNNILDNTASYNGNCGITISGVCDADYNVVDGNILSHNLAGINSASPYTQFNYNKIYSNTQHGLINTADHVSISSNLIQNNKCCGILSIGTHNNFIYNNISGNDMGICLQNATDSDYNNIKYNNVTYNKNGINSGCSYSNFKYNNLNYNNDTGLTVTGSYCLINGNSMNYNKVAGLTITGTHNNVTQNSIYNNIYGASFSTALAAVFNFNSVVGNKYQLYQPSNDGNLLNAQFNWWGSNSRPQKIYGAFNYSRWLIIKLTTVKSQIVGTSSTVTADLNHDCQGNDISHLGHVKDGSILYFYSTLGTINSKVSLVNGSARTWFKAVKPGTANISTVLDSQKVTKSVSLYSAIKSVNISNKAINVSRNKIIQLTYRIPIKFGKKVSIQLKNSKGKSVWIKPKIKGNILTITHASLSKKTKYILVIHTGTITNMKNNPMPIYTLSFTTSK